MKFRTRSLVFLSAALCLAGLCSPAAAAENWTSVRTANFFLIGDAEPAAIRDTALRLEQFREAFQIIAPELKLNGKARLNVVVFRDERSYRPFKPLRRDLSPDDAVTGYFQFGEDVSYITVTGGTTGGTIFHEYVHYLLRTNGYSSLPPWLNEGLAEYYETFRNDGAGRVEIGSAHTANLGLLKRSALIPRDEFFAADSEALRDRDNETRNLFYAQAWAAVHYLISRSGGSNGVIALLGNREARDKLLLETFPTDAAFASAIRSHTTQTKLPSRTMVLPAQTALDASVIVPLGEPEMNAYLGELLFRLGDLPAAESRLRRSIALDGTQALARVTLGKLLIEQKKYAEAVLDLEKAAAAAPGDSRAQFYYAYALSLASMDADKTIDEFPAGTAEKMTASLHRAIAADPDFAESRRLLAFVHLIGGDLDEAAAHIRKALELKPENSDYMLLLARILLRQEKIDEARTTAVKILVGLPDPKTHAAAVQIMQNADDYFEAEKAEEGDRRLFIGQLPPLILKRSTLSEADIEKIDRDRIITNFNRILGPPKAGEVQIVGNIEAVRCVDDRIVYKIKADGKTFALTGTDFTGLNMTVLIEGERTFKLDCGVSFPKQLSVLTYIPDAGAGGHEGKLVSITFVPEFFRLKTPAEMAAARIVVIQDDRLFKKKL